MPAATLMTVSANRRMGCCQALCGLRAATTMTTAVVIAAVIASPGRPISVTAQGAEPDQDGQSPGVEAQENQICAPATANTPATAMPPTKATNPRTSFCTLTIVGRRAP